MPALAACVKKSVAASLIFIFISLSSYFILKGRRNHFSTGNQPEVKETRVYASGLAPSASHATFNSMPKVQLLPGPQWNPHAPPRAALTVPPAKPKAHALIGAYPTHPEGLRDLSMVYFAFAACDVGFVILLISQSPSPQSPLEDDFLAALAALCALLSPMAVNLAIGIGLWQLRRWGVWLAVAQSTLILVIAAAGICLNESIFFYLIILPGLVLLILGLFAHYLYSGGQTGKCGVLTDLDIDFR
jgi:hypothetical protein